MTPILDLADFSDDQRTPRKLIKLVFLLALRDRATVVRFEEDGSGLRMFYKVDGALCELVPPPPHLASRIMNLIRAAAQLDRPEKPRRGFSHVRMGEYFIHIFVEIRPRESGERADVSLIYSPAAAEEAKRILTAYAPTTEDGECLFEIEDPTATARP